VHGWWGAFGFFENLYLFLVDWSVVLADDMREHWSWRLSVGCDFVKCLL
jgi:hypothetical protein